MFFILLCQFVYSVCNSLNNCLECSNADICDNCEDTYVKLNNGNKVECSQLDEANQISGCDIYSTVNNAGSGQSTCKQCVLDKYLDNNACATDCQTGYVKHDDGNLKQCSQLDEANQISGCDIYSTVNNAGSGQSTCKQCVLDKYLDNNACATDCQTGYVKHDDGNLKQCSQLDEANQISGCDIYSTVNNAGSGQSTCKQCVLDKYLDNNACATDCQTGYVKHDDGNLKQCSQLDEANQISGCDIYSTVNNAGSGQSTCKQCVLDKYLDNNACATDCQTGYVKHDDGNLKQCSQLDEANQISGCDIYSTVNNAGSGQSTCKQCVLDKYLDNNACATDCQTGYVKHDDGNLKQCSQLDEANQISGCDIYSTVNNAGSGQSTCKQCVLDKYLDNNACATDCQTGYVKHDDGNLKQCSQLDEANQISGCDIYSTVNNAGSGQSTCKQCVLDKYLDNNACATDCQTGYVKHDDGNLKQCSQLDEANQISGCDIYSTVNNAGSGQSTCKQCVLDKYLDNNACATDCQTGYVKHDDGNLKQCSQLDEANQISGCDIYSSVSPDTKCLECMESFHPTDDFKKCIKTSDQTTQPTNDGQTNEFVSESMTSTTTTTMTSTTTTTMTSTTTSTMTSTITQTSNADELETNINSEDANIDGFMNESQTEFPISVPQNIYQNSNITFIQRTGKNSRVIFQDNGASNLYFRPESNDTNENPTITFSSQKSNTNNQETVVTGVMVQNQRTTNIIIESPNITLNLLADEEGEGERIANLATTNSNVSKYDINNTLLKNKQEIVIKTADPKIPVVVHELMLFNAPTFKSGSSTVSINTVKAQQGSTSTIENCKINKQVIAGLNTSLQLVGDVNISDASVEVLYNEDIDSTRPVFVGDLLSAPHEINFSKGNINEILLEDNTSNGNSVEQKEFKLIIAQNLSNCNDWKKVINFDNSPFSSVKCEKNVNGILELVVSSNKNRSMLSSGAIAGIVIACVVVVAVIVGVSVYVSRKRSLSLGIESTINDYDSIAI